MTGIYQEMGEMIDDIKEKITDNEYLVMYNKLMDMKKVHDKAVDVKSPDVVFLNPTGIESPDAICRCV